MCIFLFLYESFFFLALSFSKYSLSLCYPCHRTLLMENFFNTILNFNKFIFVAMCCKYQIYLCWRNILTYFTSIAMLIFMFLSCLSFSYSFFNQIARLPCFHFFPLKTCFLSFCMRFWLCLFLCSKQTVKIYRVSRKMFASCN